MSTAKITIKNQDFIIPILPPITSSSEAAFLDKFYIEDSSGKRINPPDPVVSELIAASQSIFMLQSPSFSVNPSFVNSNDSVLAGIVNVNNELRIMEDRLIKEVYYENAVNAVANIATVAAGLVAASAVAALLPKIVAVTTVAGAVASISGVTVSAQAITAGVIATTAALDVSEYLVEKDTAEKKIEHVKAAIKLINMSFANYNEFTKSPAGNIFRETGEISYSLDEIKKAVEQTAVVHGTLETARVFINSIIELENDQDWIDTITDAMGTIPVLDLISLPTQVVSLLQGTLTGNSSISDFNNALIAASEAFDPAYENPFQSDIYFNSYHAATKFNLDKQTTEAYPAVNDNPQLTMADAMDMVQKLYIGFYGRPADPDGQLFWAKGIYNGQGNLESIIKAFANSREYADRFGQLEIQDVVNNLYWQSFGRSAEQTGLNYWVSEVNKGNITLGELAYTLLQGSRNNDLKTVENKLIIAKKFSMLINDQGKEYSSNQIDKGKQLLDNIKYDTDTRSINVQETINTFPKAGNSVSSNELDNIFAFTSTPSSPLNAVDAQQYVLNELGANYRVADWNDIEAMWNLYPTEMEQFFEDAPALTVTLNGSTQYSSNRYYLIRDHDGNLPSNWLAHDQVGGHEISLGSWYGPYAVLAIEKETNNQNEIGVFNFDLSAGTDASDNLLALTTRGQDNLVVGNAGNDTFNVKIGTQSNNINKTETVVVLSGGEGSDVYNLTNDSLTGYVIYDGGTTGMDTIRIPVGFDDLYTSTMNGGRDLLLYDSDTFGLLMPDWQSDRNRIETWNLKGTNYNHADLVEAVATFSEGDISNSDLASYLALIGDYSSSDINELINISKLVSNLSPTDISNLNVLAIENIGIPSHELYDYLS